MRSYEPQSGTQHRFLPPTAISWFIWKGAIFKVPLSTLQLPKEAGGTALIHIMGKCVTLFILRMEQQGQQKATFTTDWLTRWHLHGRTPNPPQIKRIPAKFDYLYHYNIEAAYTPIRADSENHKSYKKRLYTALLTSIRAAAGSPEMRIQKLWPDTDWTRIWKNLKDTPVSDNMRCVWDQVLHDLIPTNVRLHRIKMTPSISCQRCTMADTLEHRLTECGEGRRIWQYTKIRIALMLRTTHPEYQMNGFYVHSSIYGPLKGTTQYCG